MSTTYSITITGLNPGMSREAVIEQLSALLKLTEEKVTSMLASERFVVKSGVDLKTSAKYEDALQKCGCYTLIEPESNENDLIFDIPVLSQKHLVVAAQPPTAQQTLKSLIKNENTLGVIAIFCAWLLYTFVFSGGMSNSLAALEVDTLFDKAMKIDMSERSDLDIFKNAGGLENDDESSWRSFKTHSYQVQYNDQTGKLGIALIGLHKDWPGKKLASFDNLSKLMAEECGNNWTQNEAQRIGGMKGAKKNGIACIIHETGGRGGQADILVTIMKDPDPS